MTRILEIKNRIVRFVREYESYLIPLFKFILAYYAFNMIRNNLGYDSRVCRPMLLVILALICSLLPTNAIIVIATGLILVNLYALSMWAAIVALLCFFVLYLIYFRFAPKNGPAVILTPLAFHYHVPFIMPVGCSLIGGPYSILGVLCGTVFYYLIHGITSHASEIAELETNPDAGISAKVNIILRQIVGNKDMYLVLLIFVITSVFVYILRRIKIDHAWTLAIVTGILIQLVGLFVGYMTLNISGKTAWLLGGNIAALIIAFLIQFFVMDLDYSRVERVQFEDDDYYYYVKAVPKKMVASGEKIVLHFGWMGQHKKPEDEPADEESSKERKAIADELGIDEELLK